MAYNSAINSGFLVWAGCHCLALPDLKNLRFNAARYLAWQAIANKRFPPGYAASLGLQGPG